MEARTSFIQSLEIHTIHKNRWWARGDSNPGTSPCQGVMGFLQEFEQACRVDMRLAKRTIRERMRHAKRLVDFLGKHPLAATKGELRNFLEKNPQHNAIKTVRIIYGRFFNTDLAKSFKVPQTPFRPKRIPTKEQLRTTYHALPMLELKAAFLLLATSGLRRHELDELTMDQIDLPNRTIFPKEGEDNRTKKQWVTFFNQEAGEVLAEYLRGKKGDGRVFNLYADTITRKFKEVSGKNGTKISPKVLRQWFACEMGRLRAQDRYIDAFCGRVPKSVLARHYTDFSPERLKESYDNANLRVLS